MSPSEIMKMAEVEIFRGVDYGSDRKPIEGGLLDPRLGPPNKKCGNCATYGANYKDCPGHFGYLALALPVYNVGYMGTVVDILKCICKSCSGVLLKEEMRVEHLRRMRNPMLGPLKKTELMKMVVKKCNGLAANNRPVECSKCGYLNGSVKKATGMVAIIHDRSKFGGVMDELRPENLLIMNIPVPPTVIRPSVLVDDSWTNENDITERLKNIVQANARLRHDLTQDLPPAYAGGFKHSWDALQVEVAQ
ncbi:hypothetical protein L3X38_018946 [Prunus dulcis]|uniref:DNA-directed RNA polymerase n=1 Tax=Prunus dulcis TaxID=3755 RepID=A0AAD4WA70_PRUDU|nr:hypothetical protein L3X38_018946 [Prunus dulcis]